MNQPRNKYGAEKCWSNLCQRGFDSKAERDQGEDLFYELRAGEITDLEYQPRFLLNKKPRCVYTADFRYKRAGISIVEDAKGVMTEAARLRIIWLKQLTGIEVRIIK